MKTITIKHNHPFLEDLDRRLSEVPKAPFKVMLEYAKQWYGYDIIVDDHGACANITMSDSDYTLFLLRWS